MRQRCVGRQWTLVPLAKFWTAIILSAPRSLAQTLEEAKTGMGIGWQAVQATSEVFFEC
jgi:hypothetical protein